MSICMRALSPETFSALERLATNAGVAKEVAPGTHCDADPDNPERGEIA